MTVANLHQSKWYAPYGGGHLSVKHLVPQREYYVEKYKALSFTAGVAVQYNLEGPLVTRVRDINATNTESCGEMLTCELFNDYVPTLTVSDMKDFIHWLTTAPFNVVSKQNILARKLHDLRHKRLATYHVMHPDGIVPERQSMLQDYAEP